MSRLWASHSERSNTFWLWIIRTIALRLGRRAARLLLYPITLFFLIVAREQRKASRVFLSRALQRRASLWDVARHIHTFAATLVDRVYLFTDRHDRLDLRMQDRDVVLDYLKAGQPAIILGSHLGSYEVLRAIGMLRIRLPLKILMRQGHNKTITGMLNALNPDFSEMVIELGHPSASLRVHDSLKAGNFIGMLGDRAGENERVTRCTFLGKEAVFPAGPILLAHACKVPVILFFGLYRGGNRYDVFLEKFADRIELSRERREQEVQQWVQRYVDVLEKYVRLEPFNWFNFYDFWNEYSETPQPEAAQQKTAQQKTAPPETVPQDTDSR
ncbi:MAG: lipid A biosynthesis acyltransferase [SAR324 cluster bacterium]|nr:lipid A biosynthesis acyltransferase [SAR324 cluster bacterium]